MFKLYGLIDPRTNKICYIGITKSTLKVRLRQHNSPKSTNEAPIAKLSRYLKVKKMNLSIVLLETTETQEEIFDKEIQYIKKYKQNGYKLKNVQAGGQLTGNALESILKGNKNYKINKELGLHKNLKGENNPISIFTNEQVLKIYKLIKKFYSNEEIIDKMDLKCRNTVIQAIRSGQNWKHLWVENFNEMIPAIFMTKNGIKPREKLLAIDLMIKGYSLDHIGKKFPRIKYDIYKVRDKKIWVKVWEVYYNFYIKRKSF